VSGQENVARNGSRAKSYSLGQPIALLLTINVAPQNCSCAGFRNAYDA